jgi:hypothetical protein
VDTRHGENWVGILIAADPAFAQAWTHYKPIAAFDGLRVLRRQGTTCSTPIRLPRITSTQWDEP